MTSEDEDARKAADDLDEIAIGQPQRKPATKLKFDLDLPPEAVDPTRLDGELTLSGMGLPQRAATITIIAACSLRTRQRDRRELGPGRGHAPPDPPGAPSVRGAAAPPRTYDGRSPTGTISTSTRWSARAAICAPAAARLDRVHLAMRPQGHDLAVTLLVDVSLSTDAWVDGHRVLDVEKEALLVLAHGLSACGDHNSILTFTSRRRSLGATGNGRRPSRSR